jgi:hypothetical protein
VPVQRNYSASLVSELIRNLSTVCKRRHVAMHHVPDEVKKLVLLGRWKSGVCIGCFDEMAQLAGVAYSFDEVSATSWSEAARGN